MHWTDIQGWLSLEEGEKLRELAQGRTVLELGSWKGRSTVAMAEVALQVVCLDTFKGDSHTGPASTFKAFHENLKQFGVLHKVHALAGLIEHLAPALPVGLFDLVFVDASHDEGSVERDTRIALSVLRNGGVIAWHDANYASVQEGVTRAGLRFEGLVDSLAWASVAARNHHDGT